MERRYLSQDILPVQIHFFVNARYHITHTANITAVADPYVVLSGSPFGFCGSHFEFASILRCIRNDRNSPSSRCHKSVIAFPFAAFQPGHSHGLPKSAPSTRGSAASNALDSPGRAATLDLRSHRYVHASVSRDAIVLYQTLKTRERILMTTRRPKVKWVLPPHRPDNCSPRLAV